MFDLYIMARIIGSLCRNMTRPEEIHSLTVSQHFTARSIWKR